MTFAKFDTNSRPEPEMPDALYIGFVDSLLVETRGLVMTVAGTVLASALVSVAIGSWVQWSFTALMVVIGSIRLRYMIAHAKSRPSPSIEAANKWERNYVIGASIYMALLGLWTVAVFRETDDSFSRIASTLTTVSCAFGIWTRSYAIKKGTNAQLLFAFLPLCAAFVGGGGLSPVLVPIVLVPVFLFIKTSSAKLRENFLDEIIARREAATLAGQLDTALNNMSHGLCMIDREGKVIVANEQVLRIFNLRPQDAEVGADMRAIMRLLVRNEVIARSEVERLSHALFHGGEG